MTTARAKGELFLRSRSHSKWRYEITGVALNPNDHVDGSGGDCTNSAVQADPTLCSPQESKEMLWSPTEQPKVLSPEPSASLLSRVNEACEYQDKSPVLVEKSLRNLLYYLEKSRSASAKRQLGHICQCLSRCLSRQGQMAEAEMYQWRSLQYNTEFLGQNHPDTIANLSCIAVFLYRKRQYQFAKMLALRVLQSVSKIHGAEHNQTLAATHNLAIIDAAIIEEIQVHSAAQELVRIRA